MGKELVRNGGFERGNLDFWLPDVPWNVLETTIKHRGSYAAKAVSAAGMIAILYQKDYIEVKTDEIYQISCWTKNTSLDDIAPGLILYDKDLNQVLLHVFEYIATEAAWTNHIYYYKIPKECSYIQLYFRASDATAGVGYLDDVSLQHIDIADIAVTDEELIAVVNETTKHTVTGSEFFTGIWKEAEYFFDLTSFTETVGANPVTIDVKIETYDPQTGKWRDAMVFQQKICGASGSVITQEYKRIGSNLGWKQRVSYTTAGAGTIGDCDFKVGVVYKR